ncbi:MAG TPA: Mur ligase domain-containing protein [Patescibacteria group bacterium]|nr:Mur ligase domain-containing protein [Patescibacteria group bacterium]
MKIHFIGIGGTAIGPLALIAKQAGYNVSGSDKQGSAYIEYLRSQGITDIYTGESREDLAEMHRQQSIDLVVHSSAVSIENPNHPEIAFARDNNIRTAKRDELLNKIIKDNKLKLIAVAGTHGKTTTTAMIIWLFKHLGLPASYSVGAKIPYGDMGHYDDHSKYFIYECDEFDRNFLAFHPYISIITGIDYDHQEQYPDIEDYRGAFRQFLGQSEHKIVWQEDIRSSSLKADDNLVIVDKFDDQYKILNTLSILGLVNRRDALQAIIAVHKITKEPLDKLATIMNGFPGVSRRFEKITENLYSDYAHTIPKIKGCLQLSTEVSKDIVIVYEPLTNRRQYFIRDEYKTLFKDVKQLYWVPSYLAREDPAQPVITPQEFIDRIEAPKNKEAAELNESLKLKIREHLQKGDIVVCLSGGGGNSLDEWLRQNF